MLHGAWGRGGRGSAGVRGVRTGKGVRIGHSSEAGYGAPAGRLREERLGRVRYEDESGTPRAPRQGGPWLQHVDGSDRFLPSAVARVGVASGALFRGVLSGALLRRRSGPPGGGDAAGGGARGRSSGGGLDGTDRAEVRWIVGGE